MKLYKRIGSAVICFIFILSQIGCNQAQTAPAPSDIPATETMPVQTDIPTKEPPHISVDEYLDAAQDFVDAGNFTSAVALLEEVQSITEDARITTMLAHIDSIWITELEADLFTTAEHLRSGKVVIHNVSVQERSNKVTRYTIDYSAPAGMYVRLVAMGLDHYFDFQTNGQRDTFTFEIDSEDIRQLNGTVGMQFGFADENFYYLEITVRYPIAELPETDDYKIPDEFEVSFHYEDKLRNAQGDIKNIVVKDTGDSWKFTLSHTLPADMDARVFLWTARTSQLAWEKSSATDTLHNSLQFELSKEDISQWENITINFIGADSDNYSATMQLPFQILRTFESPLVDPVQVPYSIENELKTGNYEVHEISAQKLSNGYVRFTTDMTVSEDIHISAVLNINAKNGGGNQRICDFTSNGERKQYCLDIHESQLEKSNYLYLFVQVGRNDQNRFFVNIPHAFMTASTEGVPVSPAVPLNLYVWENPDEMQYKFHSCTAQKLNNGYFRYTLTCTLPQNEFCYFFDPPTGNNVHVFLASSSDAGENTIVIDVKEEIAKTTSELTFLANFSDTKNQVFITIENSSVALMESTPDISVTLVNLDEPTPSAAP